jgi:hypothetical protein
MPDFRSTAWRHLRTCSAVFALWLFLPCRGGFHVVSSHGDKGRSAQPNARRFVHNLHTLHSVFSDLSHKFTRSYLANAGGEKIAAYA